jgi:signal transduction histidine kinase
VYADSDRVTQLLSNIIGNAIKFTPDGGDVELVAYPQGDDVLFVVTDTGAGIDTEHLPHVFERFFQANATGRRGSRQGAGLGLPIARGIVEAHGGRIWVDSSAGSGTTVCFTLRRVGDENTPAS